MSLILRTIITALAAVAAHIGFLMILSGGQAPISGPFFNELVIRWTIAALFANSISWPMPRFATAFVVGALSAINMAFIVLTFQGQWAFFQRALMTNGAGAVGLAIGAAIAAMIFAGKKS